MKTSSKKAKGRSLQKYVCATILKYWPQIPILDVTSRAMGSQGSDVVMSDFAKSLVPFKFECKNQESFKSIYDAYEQSAKQKEKGEPLLVLKMNRKSPLVVLDFEYFMELAEYAHRK